MEKEEIRKLLIRFVAMKESETDSIISLQAMVSRLLQTDDIELTRKTIINELKREI